MKEATIDKILVSLDSLIDTRAGVIIQKYPDRIDKVLTSKYYSRGVDVFETVRKEEFDELYSKRDVTTLKHSMMTNAHLLLASFIRSAVNESVAGGAETKLIISLNIHPYKLEPEDKEDLLGALEFILGEGCEFEVVSIPPEFLTPQICKDQYSVLVMYEFRQWMEMHAPAFKECRMPNVIIYAPKILSEKPSAEEMKEFTEAGMDPFEAARISAAPAFALRFVTVDVFCARNAVEDMKRNEERQMREQIRRELENPPVEKTTA